MRALVVLCLVAAASASLVSIDLGSEFVRAALIKPGKVPISIVSNEMSRRKSPALVGVVDGDRLAGEEAFSMAIRYPDKVVARVRDMLGRSTSDAHLAALVASQRLPYPMADHPERGTITVAVNETTTLLAEELLAGLLQYVKQITEAQAGSPVVDAVITVPAWFGTVQRRALVDAASLAGLNVLALINSHAAAALQYGIERDFTGKEQQIILYDQGSGSTEVALVRYSTYQPKDSKAKPINQFDVVDVDWDASVGSNTLDMLMVEHFADQFAKKYPEHSDIRESPKAMAKLKRQVRRTKEILSANTAAPLSVEELHGGQDFRATITRDEFETLAGDFFKTAAAPLVRLVERNGLSAKDVDAVELLGGGSRVPRLQAALSEALAGRSLDRHLDADEAVVMGAALFAANLSTSFRLRKFGMVDKVHFGITFEAQGLDGQLPSSPDNVDASDGLDTHAGSASVKALLPVGKKLPIKRAIKYNNLTVDTFSFKLSYNASGPHGLPPGTTHTLLGSWTVSGIASVVERYNHSGSCALMFEADHGGLISLDKVTCIVEQEVLEDKVVEVPVESNMTANATTDGDVNATASNATTFTTIKVPRRKLFKVPIDLAGDWGHAPLSGDMIKAAKATAADWLMREALKKATAKAKNDLEAYIIATREALEADETMQQVSTQKLRDDFNTQLTDAEDWLYSEGEAEGAIAFMTKLTQLRKVGDPIKARASELQQRPEVLKEVKQWLDVNLKMARAWPEAKPWLDATETAAVTKQIEEYQKWLKDQEAAQAKKKLHDDPAFTVLQVQEKLEPIIRRFGRLNAKRKPKPAPAPANATANSTEQAAEEAKEDGGAEGAGDGDAHAGSEEQQDTQQPQAEVLDEHDEL